MIDTYLDNEMEAWEKASDNDCEKLPSGEAMTSDPATTIITRLTVENIKQRKAIRAAIKKLEGPGMPYRAREAIQILTEAQDDNPNN